MLEYTCEPCDRPELFKRPSLFLSASVPEPKDYPDNARHLETARPQWIRDAVLGFARTAFRNDFNIVSGAHPSISPMLLEVVREFPPPTGSPRVVLFQSDFFRDRIPRETLELADGTLGVLFRTAIQPATATSDAREASLECMRKAMFTVPALTAAAFIGGMNGVIDEAELFKVLNPELPAYAIASAGAAGADLLEKPPPAFTVNAFAGAPHATVPESALRATYVGYMILSRAVFGAIARGRAANRLNPRS